VKQKIPFLRNFNWRILLLRILINAAALFLTAALVPDIYFVDRSLASLLLLAVGLGLLNAFVKPVLQVLTLHFIFASYGLIVILINAFYALDRLFQRDPLAFAPVALVPVGCELAHQQRKQAHPVEPSAAQSPT
jgi:hypothetical protein